MLILSRKAGQAISLPDLGIQIEVAGIRGRTTTIGIDAPPEVKIIRSELAARDGARIPLSPRLRSSFDTHEGREQLHTVSLALYGLQYQMNGGQTPENALLRTAIDQLEALQDSLGEGHVPARKHFALIVEDDQHECNLLAGFLRQVGFQVETAADGETALRFLRNSKKTPDAMLLDLNMPVEPPEDVMRGVRQIPEAINMQLYGVSGKPPESPAATDGLRRCFLKPLQPEELAHTIKRDLAA